MEPPPPRPPSENILVLIRDFVSRHAEILGFGCLPAGPAASRERLLRFLAQGHQAGMDYLNRNIEARIDPRQWAPWAKSVVLFALKPPARFKPLHPPERPIYSVAAYAQGEDYHARAWRLLKELEEQLEKEMAGELPMALKNPESSGNSDLGQRLRGFVDTSPVFERDLAASAGLGWRAKNCTLLHREHGSGFMLFGVMLAVDLPPSQPVQEFCGGCTRCLDACPTQAFTAPGELDARKCISYWTIEHRGELPDALSEKFGSWIFGCDICQSVCPWNRKHMEKSQPVAESALPQDAIASPPPQPSFDLSGVEWLDLLRQGGGFQSRFKNSPLSRAGRKGLMRNVAKAAANQDDREVLPNLRTLLAEESDPMLQSSLSAAILRLESDAKTKTEVHAKDRI